MTPSALSDSPPTQKELSMMSTTSGFARPGVDYMDLPKCTRPGCLRTQEGTPHEFTFEFRGVDPIHHSQATRQAGWGGTEDAGQGAWTVSLEAVGTGPWATTIHADPCGHDHTLTDLDGLGVALRKAGKLRDKLNLQSA